MIPNDFNCFLIIPICSGSLVWLLSPAWDAVTPTCQEVGFICPFVIIDPTDLGSTTVVAPGQMLDNFQPILDAESLPFCPSVLTCKASRVCSYQFFRLF